MTRVTPGRQFLDAVLAGEIASEECIFWPFSTNQYGYGDITIDGKMWGVHRYICKEIHGDPPSPKHEAAHSCENGHLACINPKHVRWRSRKENANESTRKLGRPPNSARMIS